jgi:hypothetical protein
MAKKKTSKPSPRCLVRGCNTVAEIRGVCKPCYRAMRYRVELDLTTWDKLEKEGVILPGHGPKKPSAFAKQFDGG